MKLYINRKILLGLIISIAIIGGLGILSYRYFLSLTAATQWSSHARQVIQNVEEVRSKLIIIENSKRGHSITGEESYVKAVSAGISNLNSLVSDLETATKDNSIQQENIKKLPSLISAYVNETTLAGRNRELEKIQRQLDQVKEEEQSLILTRSLNVQKGFYRFVSAFIGLILVTLAVLLALVWLINSNTRSRSIAEERLREAQLETKKINEDLEAFSYSVSHDLRAPLRSINGYSQILIEDYAAKLDDEGIRILNVVITNAKRMGQLIDDLLEFSRLGRKELNRTVTDVNEQVRTIAAELLERETDRKIDFKMQPLGTAKIDSTMMRQVWINLIGNAIKYSKNNDVATIEVGRSDEKGKISFYVKDNGAGFDMAYVDKLFGVFQRLHKNNEFEGTGVGLALVKRIVERHNGKIWAEGKVGEGATFYFTLLVD